MDAGRRQEKSWSKEKDYITHDTGSAWDSYSL